MTLPLYTQTDDDEDRDGDEEEDAEHILTCCPRFRWPGEESLGPVNGIAVEL